LDGKTILSKEINMEKISADYNFKIQWETIHEDDIHDTYRAKVFGGWLVMRGEWGIFIPDKNHEWGN
jgi:hypothetical protein